jgi:hypothetical protein
MLKTLKNALLLAPIILTAVSTASCGIGSNDAGWPFRISAVHPYLGEPPPGTDPVVFAQGTVSSADNFEMGITFSPDGREIYFARSEGADVDASWSIWVCREERSGWSTPRKADFSRFRDISPHMAPDGLRFFFFSQNPLDPEYQEGTYVVERVGDGWGEAVFFNKGYGIATAISGNLYGSSDHHYMPNRDIVVFREEGSGFSEQRALPGDLHSDGYDAHVAVAPDESFILFDSNRSTDPPRARIHVAFRREDGSWNRPEVLGGKINAVPSLIPAISPDGKYVFFHRNGDIWWVSSAVIDRPS